jgi:hypothetical protein
VSTPTINPPRKIVPLIITMSSLPRGISALDAAGSSSDFENRVVEIFGWRFLVGFNLNPPHPEERASLRASRRMGGLSVETSASRSPQDEADQSLRGPSNSLI